MNHLIGSIAKYEGIGASQRRKIINGRECGKNRGYFHRIIAEEKEDKWIGVKENHNEGKFKLVVNPHENSIYSDRYFKKMKGLAIGLN